MGDVDCGRLLDGDEFEFAELRLCDNGGLLLKLLSGGPALEFDCPGVTASKADP